MPTTLDATNYPLSPSRPPKNEFLRIYHLLNAATVAASADGSAVTTQYSTPQEVRILGQSGVVSGTSPTLDILIQESADGSTNWVTIATIPQVIAANQIFNQIVTKTKKYLRYSHTLGGTSTPKVNYNLNVLE